MFRRGFLLSSAALLASCGAPISETEVRRTAASCRRAPDPDDILRIDMHCHLMNGNDGNAGEFVNRRYSNTIGMQIPNGFVRGIASAYTETIDEEIARLRTFLENPMAIDTFCAEASAPQRTIIPSQSSKPATLAPFGFLRNRLRNAALLIAAFPDVDLFLPSMVDLYEVDDVFDGYHALAQRDFYSKLTIATGARMLPFVSFNPERVASPWGDEDYTLAFVEEAILRHGFVGVKIHPSAGFDPLDNSAYGCPNTKAPDDTESEPYGDRETGRAIQEAMDALYELCDRLNVPLLSHHGTKMAANQTCMMRGEDSTEWTNSTSHWIALLKDKLKDKPNFRVCLSHLSGGITDEDGDLGPAPWFTKSVGYIGEALREDGDCKIWLDISAQRRLFVGDQTDAMVNALKDALAREPAMTGRLMYGSDWHMPEALVKNYLYNVENFFDDFGRSDRNKVMGRNAVKYLGLDNVTNQTRLHEFLDKNGIDLETIPWFVKMKRLGLV